MTPAPPSAEYAEPYHDPANPLRMDRHIGRCHICRLDRPITYCSLCHHWLCRACRDDWYARADAAMQQKIDEILMKLWLKRDTGPCCGPRGGRNGEVEA